MTRTVVVDLGARSYEVLVGRDVLTEVREMLPPGVQRVALVTQEAIIWRPELAGLPTTTHLIGDGEQFKTLATVEQLCREFARAGLTRSDAVVAVGGGMVTDVAGFAAACYHRGTAVVHVPTTLLGMVDAAIGGKTGVNLPEGKNLVGAFWQPSAVICDLNTLGTLPERERRCGNGEMAKYHFITGEDLSSLEIVDRVTRCVEIKAEIVAADERENGRRALLNYGHTLAHALEVASGHTLAHGEAVGIGLVYAALLARHLDRIDDRRVREHLEVVADEYGLAVRPDPGLDSDQLVTLMRRDKKSTGGLTFVLDGVDGLEVVSDVAPAAVYAALEALRSIEGPSA